jgi:hypothetical protein
LGVPPPATLPSVSGLVNPDGTLQAPGGRALLALIFPRITQEPSFLMLIL